MYKPSRGAYSIPAGTARAPSQGTPWQTSVAGSGHGGVAGAGDANLNSSASGTNKIPSSSAQDGQSVPGVPKGGSAHHQQSGVPSIASVDGYGSGKNTGGAESVGGGPGGRGVGAVDGGAGTGDVAPSSRVENNFQEQMSPSALQAIKQISKVSRQVPRIS